METFFCGVSVVNIIETSEYIQTIKHTSLLVGGLDVVAVANQSADSFSQAVPIGLLGALVQQGVGHQAGVALTLHVLRRKDDKSTQSIYHHVHAPFQQCTQANCWLGREPARRPPTPVR